MNAIKKQDVKFELLLPKIGDEVRLFGNLGRTDERGRRVWTNEKGVVTGEDGRKLEIKTGLGRAWFEKEEILDPRNRGYWFTPQARLVGTEITGWPEHPAFKYIEVLERRAFAIRANGKPFTTENQLRQFQDLILTRKAAYEAWLSTSGQGPAEIIADLEKLEFGVWAEKKEPSQSE